MLCAFNTVVSIFKHKKNVKIEMVSLGEIIRVSISRTIFFFVSKGIDSGYPAMDWGSVEL